MARDVCARETRRLSAREEGAAGSASSRKVDDSSCCDERKEAQTLLCKSCVRLKEGQTFSNLLDARKKQMNISRFGNSDFMGMHKQCS
jgi:hypothetical protein